MSTIAAGQVAGMSREAALEFSFFLSLPTMFVATAYDLLKSMKGGGPNPLGVVQIDAHGWTLLGIGFSVAFVVAYGSVAALMAWVRRRGFAPFAAVPHSCGRHRAGLGREARDAVSVRPASPPAPAVTGAKPPLPPFRRFFANLGPGLITGAADDDPSGISTYSVAGAAFGYVPLWTALFSFPLMTAVQLMCARLGLVTGLGLAGVIRRRYSRWVLWGACALLIVANVINIAADLGGMAEATAMVTGAPVGRDRVPVFGAVDRRAADVVVVPHDRPHLQVADAGAVRLRRHGVRRARRLARRAARRRSFPHVEWSRAFFSVLVAILGTTISPYLFFWQAAQEVEEERAMGRNLARATRRDGAELRSAAAPTSRPACSRRTSSCTSSS